MSPSGMPKPPWSRLSSVPVSLPSGPVRTWITRRSWVPPTSSVPCQLPTASCAAAGADIVIAIPANVAVQRFIGPSLSAHRLHLGGAARSEEHTSELQSRENLVCRLLLE